MHAYRGKRFDSDIGEFSTLILDSINISMYLSGLIFLGKYISMCEHPLLLSALNLDIPATTFAKDLMDMTSATLISINAVRCKHVHWRLCGACTSVLHRIDRAV